MSSTTLPPNISAEERSYYLATAMLSTAFDYGREGDAEIWWLTLEPLFVSRACVVSFRLADTTLRSFLGLMLRTFASSRTTALYFPFPRFVRSIPPSLTSFPGSKCTIVRGGSPFVTRSFVGTIRMSSRGHRVIAYVSGFACYRLPSWNRRSTNYQYLRTRGSRKTTQVFDNL